MIKYLLFDLDNTLYSCRYGLENNVRRRMQEFTGAYLGLSPEEAWRQRLEYRYQYGTNLEWLMGEKGFTDVEAYIAAVHPKDEADALRPDPELRSFLESLPVPRAILTNSPREHVDLILNKLDIQAGLFTHIFEVRQFGFKGKPHPDVFNRVLQTLGMRAEDVLFIDDSPVYVEGFIALGGKALLLDEKDAHGDFPHQRIRYLRELTGYLESAR